MAGGGQKHKGTDRHNPRDGMGRLRRAHAQDGARAGGWEHHDNDDAAADLHAALGKRSHAGEHLLAKFNRLARAQAHDQGEPGEICGFSGRQVWVRLPSSQEIPCEVRQVLKKQVSGVKNPLVVGDGVRIERHGDESIIIGLTPRRNQLARADSHNRSLIHVFAANIDRLVIVSSVREPDLKTGLIDRYLLIAALNDITPVIVLNKADLGDPVAALELYRSIGFAVHTTDARQADSLAGLRAELSGRACVFAGQSGVGKSSLINALFPASAARTGVVANEGFGRHTTTASRSYLLPDGGRLIDTPGIRECAITGIEPLDVGLLYPDLAALHPQCHFTDCSHRHEPGCAVIAALEAGQLPHSRYHSYCSIIDEDLATPK